MATIPLQQGYRLKSDSRQWMLQKLGNKPNKAGEDVWTSIRYSGTLSSAVQDAYAYFIRQSEADTIEAFMQDSKRTFNKLVECLTPVVEINEK